MKRVRAALLGLALIAMPWLGHAAPPPIPGTVSVTANVCGPGAVDPTITKPSTGNVFTASVITVSGTATPSQPVEVYRNDVLAGTALADSIGAYSVAISLVKGQNVLVARSCSNSNAVTVTYAPPPTPPKPPPVPVTPTNNNGTTAPPGPIEVVINPTPATGAEASPYFYLQSPLGVLEGLPGDTIQLPLTIMGGRGPFQLTVRTGDGATTSLAATERSLLVRHSYNAAGRYLLVVEVTDASGTTAYLQTVVQIDPGAPVAGTTVPDDNSGLALGLIFLLEQLILALVFAVWEYYLRNRTTADEDVA